MSRDNEWRRMKPTTLLSALLIISLLVNLVLLAALFHRSDAPDGRTSPCMAIPTKLILEDPACAEKLIRAMNVTNVRVISKISMGDAAPLHSGRPDRS